MTERKIDPMKYAGMSPQDAERAMMEDRRRAIAEDPRTVAALQAVEDREREALFEERERAEEARQRREREAAARWEEERTRRRNLWIAGGGAESEFDSAWPEIKDRLLMERVSGAEERRRREAFAGFKL